MALTWVIFSDRLVAALVRSRSLLTVVQTFKGSAFVAGSALLIFVLMRRELRERERDRERLRHAEATYRTLVEQIPAITYVNAVDQATRTLYISPQAQALLGFEAREWLEDPDLWYRRLHAEDRERTYARWLRGRDEGEPFSQEYRMLSREGRVVWFRDDAAVLADGDGRPSLIHGVMFDITERKRAEEERRRSETELRASVEALRRTDEQRRSLLSRLASAEELERRRIASDIHDGPIQKLTAVGLRLQMLRSQLGDPEKRRAVEEALGTVERTTTSLRQLVFELRPLSLERDGLVVALREYLDQASSEAGFEYQIENRLDLEPPAEVGAAVYRIAREALANVRKHARARNVRVALDSRSGGIKVRVEDDGVGFESAGAEGSSPGHLGLADMRERAEMAGGWFKAEGVPADGTTIEFWVPWPSGGHSELPDPAPREAGPPAEAERAERLPFA